jgi:thioredoxin reductase
VVLFDHGKPRNYASHGVHCFLGHDRIAPDKLREKGRSEATRYGVTFIDSEVVSACELPGMEDERAAFEVATADRRIVVRAILLTTGVVDVLPEIPGFREMYGSSIHHCPYCDGWEHRDQRLVAFGGNEAPMGLAASLKTWSRQVTACTNGHKLDTADARLLEDNEIPIRREKVTRLNGVDGNLKEVVFESGPPLECDALFFSAEQVQRSPLAKMLGCEDDEEHVKTERKQKTCVEGIFVAGDADGDVQFAIVAAAEGAIAATAINTLLQKQDQQPKN